MTHHCALVSKASKNEERIKRAFVNIGSAPCQFSGRLTAEHKHDGEYFCLMHLPYEVKMRRGLQNKFESALNDQIAKKQSDFSFISASNLLISGNLEQKRLNFEGSTLWTLRLEAIDTDDLNLNNTIIYGNSQIKKSKISHINIRNSIIKGNIILDDLCEIEHLIIKNSSLSTDNRSIYPNRPSEGFIISNFEIKRFVFAENKCRINLEIINSEIEDIDLRETEFYLCPIFSEEHLKELKHLILPNKNSFKLSRLQKQYTKRNDRNGVIWQDQYRKFRNIYNLCKKRHMHSEQASWSSPHF